MATSGKRVGRYELGRTLGEGTFAKVKFATDVETQLHYAVKVFNRENMSRELQRQIKEEIAIIRHVRHPNVVNLHEVLASRTHVYVVLELVTGGELFDKVVTAGRLEDKHARVYFQQLIDGVAYCHERRVCHRDLKPENLLLDASGRLKISDFGLSCLPEQRGRSMDSLQTTCGTPNYVAPEVLRGQGYDGRSADVWSCGCILYVLCSGHMPFDEPQLAALFVAITQARYRMPPHFSAPLQDLIRRILNPDPKQRATIEEIQRHEWFTPGYVPAEPLPDAGDADGPGAASDDEFIEVNVVRTSEGGVVDHGAARPPAMTAFDLIGSASGLDLSAMFQRGAGVVSKQPTRFPSAAPAADIVAALQKAAASLGLALPHGVSRNFKVRMEGVTRRGPLVVVAQVFEMCPGFHMVDVRKARGDLLEFQDLFAKLEQACASVALQPHQPQQAAGLAEGPSSQSLSASI